MLNEEHFLGAGREAGDRICQLVVEQGEVLAAQISPANAPGSPCKNCQRKGLEEHDYDALNDLFNAIDPRAYSAALTEWLQANSGILPLSLALDGKSIGDGKCGMIVTL